MRCRRRIHGNAVVEVLEEEHKISTLSYASKHGRIRVLYERGKDRNAKKDRSSWAVGKACADTAVECIPGRSTLLASRDIARQVHLPSGWHLPFRAVINT